MSTDAPANVLSPRPARGFAGRYASRPPGPDEMLEADGSLRPHWRMFVTMLDDLGREELGRRWEQARRLIHENGSPTTSTAIDGMDRPWSLDFVRSSSPPPSGAAS